MERERKNFFTRLFSRHKDETAEVEPEVDDQQLSTVGRQLPHTILVFTPEQLEKYPVEEREELQQQVNSYPPLTIGEVNFVPFEVGQLYGGYYLKVFIRNGKELLQEFSLTDLQLFLIDATGEKVAGGRFDLGERFGTLKFGEARLWTFAWRPEQVYKQHDVDLSTFSVAFE